MPLQNAITHTLPVLCYLSWQEKGQVTRQNWYMKYSADSDASAFAGFGKTEFAKPT